MVRDQALACSGLLEPQGRWSERLSAPARRACGKPPSTASGPGRPARARTATAAVSTHSGGGPCRIPRWPPSTRPAARSARSSGSGPTRHFSRSSRSTTRFTSRPPRPWRGGSSAREARRSWHRARYGLAALPVPAPAARAGRAARLALHGRIRAISQGPRPRDRSGNRTARAAAAGDGTGRAGRLDHGRQRALEPRRRLDQRLILMDLD